ncbi:MAG: hypothetical protein ACYS7Y_20260 [Planctomycetota bacterium]|jgi:hypothetical protein
MKKADVEIGGEYIAKVSGRLQVIKIVRESHCGGWDAVNTKTKRAVRVRSAQRLRRPAGGKFVIACNGRYLDGEPSWVTSKACAKRFDSITLAARFFARMSSYDIESEKAEGATIEEVAR